MKNFILILFYSNKNSIENNSNGRYVLYTVYYVRRMHGCCFGGVI